MMICPRCGKPVEDNDMFCPSCGQKIERPAAQPAAGGTTPVKQTVNMRNTGTVQPVYQAGTPQPVMPQPVMPVQAPKAKKKGLSKGALIGIIAGAVALVVGIGAVVYFTLLAPAKYDVSQYIESYGFYGYDGDGYADEFYLDSYEMMEETHFDNYEDYDRLYTVLSSAWISVTPSEGLSNGDTVTVTVNYDGQLAKKNRVKLTGTTMELTVEGLKKRATASDITSDILDSLLTKGRNRLADYYDYYDSFSIDPVAAYFVQDDDDEGYGYYEDCVAMVYKCTYTYEDWWEEETVTEVDYCVVDTDYIEDINSIGDVGVYLDDDYESQEDAANSITKMDGYGYKIIKLDF